MRRRVVAVAFEDFLLLDLAGPLGALELTEHFVDNGGYAIELISVRGGMVRASSGINVETILFDPRTPVDLMIVPGGNGTGRAAANEPLLHLLRDVSAHAQRTASVCSGALLLSAAGLLEGKRATTHWGAADALRLNPDIDVDSESIYIADGNVWTSAGITTGIDLALALIESDHGFAVAQQVARGLVVHHRRQGGQRQFSAALALQGPDGRFGPLLDWARAHLHERLDVDRLAAQCGLSPRQFSRAFIGATGQSPAKAIENLRVDQARSDVLAGQENLDVVARRYGFESAARMRRAFIRVLGASPHAMRHVS